MKTLLLDRDKWDVVLDASGNWATATNPYSLAQDAASAIKLFAGELWYDATKGVPYFTQVLGFFPSINLMKSLFVTAAMTVPDVVAAQVFITGFANRTVTGQVQVTDQNGVISVASF